MGEIASHNYDIASRNARILKPIAVLSVVFGHFYAGSGHKNIILDYWWNISSISLVYFAITSSFFTNRKYGNHFNISEYWSNKIIRLGLSLVVLNLFLLVLFIFRNKSGIFSLHSVIHFIGMSGFLNWFGIQNQSPFGAGLWFLTLLIVFYLLYPLLKALYSKFNNIALTSFFVFLLIVLDRCNLLNINHTLFLTACGFFIGMHLSKNNIHLSNFISIVLLFILFTLFFIMNFINIKFLNGFFIVFIPSIVFISTMKYDLNYSFLKRIKYLDSVVLEIFVVHSYLFFYQFQSFILNMIVSFLIIIAVSVALNKITTVILHTQRKHFV